MANPVDLKFHVSAQLLAELTQNGSNNGVNAYLWYNNTSAFTTVISNGVASGGTFNSTTGTTDWTLTLTPDSGTAADQVSGGKVYLLIQSNPTSTPTINDLTTLIGTTEGNINPANAFAWNFSYDTFEVALANNTADVADLSSINSFGHQLGISVTYADNTVQARGYNSTYPASGATSIDGLINTAAASVPGHGSTPAVINFPTGSTLAGQGMIAITPATDNGNQAPAGYTTVWQATQNWQDYVTTVGALSDVQLVGHFNGAKDGSPTFQYHNAGYYAYSVAQQSLAAGAYGAAGDYFVLSPDASSQIKGYVVISQQSLMDNLYSPGLGTAPAYLFSDAALQNPYNLDGASPTGEMNTGANNQWGNIFTQLFTGFSGGYYGGLGQSIPTHHGSPYAPATTVNLDQNYNWDPTYAFDGARANTIAAAQHYDPYAKIYFDNSNVYGTAYGDALTTNFTSSVTVPVYNTSGGVDVQTIDLWGFGATETMTTVPGTGGSGQPPSTNFYAPYTIDNYIAPGAADYAVPISPSSGNNLSLNLANNGLVVDPDSANIQLGIYLGAGQFQYLALPTGADQHGGGYWQTWQITQDTSKPAGQQFGIASIPIPANFNAVPPTAYVPYTSAGQVGALNFDNLPAVAGQTNWYQLLVGGKTFNFYATLNGSSDVTALAADGLANVTPPSGTQTSISLSIVPGSMDSLPSSVMEAYSSSTVIAGLAQPTSPVAGTLSGSGLTLALTPVQTGAGQGQAVDVASSVYLTSGTSLGFGWTGTSTAANTSSWISAATNKIAASNVAHVAAIDLTAGLTVNSWNVTPDIDGQWTTPTSYAFTAGAYAVRMTEMLADGVTPYGKASSPVYVVISATGAIVDTAAHISGALDAYQAVNASLTSITVSDNNPITVNWAGMTADSAALAKTVNANASAYKLNVVDQSTTIIANLAALNGNATVVGIGFTDPGIPTLTFTNADYTTTYSTAIGEMMGPRTISVTGVTGESYTAFEQDYRHGVLASGANGSGVLELTRQFTTGYTGSGPITSAATWEHDIDSASRAVRDVYTTAVFSTMPAPYPVATASGASYPSPGPTNLTFASVEYDYANGGASPVLSTYSYSNTSGPPGSITEVDTFDVNNHQTSQKFSGFNPQASNNYVAATETDFAMINGAQVVTATKNFYQYITPVSGNHYTLAEETLDSSGRVTRHFFSGLYGAVGEVFSSYEHDFLGGTLSGSKYFKTGIQGQPYTSAEIDLNASGDAVRVAVTGITSQAYSSYENDYAYANGAWGGGGVVGQKYFYTNIEGQSYTAREVDLDATGAITSVTYSGYTVTGTQPYSSLEYLYAGGTATGAYNAYVTNIAGQNWTGEEHDFNTAGQLVRQLFTGVTDQTSTAYEYDYANGNGVLTGQKFYYTNVQNQGYSTYEYDYTAASALALEIYNMNDGSHRIIGTSISQTIDSIFDDLTTGGGGADTFAYTPYFGQATITDFTSGTDLISLPSSEFADFAYVQSHTQIGGSTVITGTNGDTLTLQNFTTPLVSGDFTFT